MESAFNQGYTLCEHTQFPPRRIDHKTLEAPKRLTAPDGYPIGHSHYNTSTTPRTVQYKTGVGGGDVEAL